MKFTKNIDMMATILTNINSFSKTDNTIDDTIQFSQVLPTPSMWDNGCSLIPLIISIPVMLPDRFGTIAKWYSIISDTAQNR
jgi:hypothetical protein